MLMRKNQLEKEAEDAGGNKEDQREEICEEAGSWKLESRGQEQGLIISRERRLFHCPFGRGGKPGLRCHRVCRFGGREGA